jgi:hypothetical protein
MPDRPKSQCSFVYITRVTLHLTDGIGWMISTFHPSGNQPRSVAQRPHGMHRRIHLFRWNHSFCNLHSARLQHFYNSSLSKIPGLSILTLCVPRAPASPKTMHTGMGAQRDKSALACIILWGGIQTIQMSRCGDFGVLGVC